MNDNYSKAYKEVIEILKYVPKESVKKIPKDVLKTFEIKMDKNYEFSVDIDKSFEEQELLEETKAILANIFRDYWATPYQRERIIAKEKYDRQKDEEEKRKLYNSQDIFKKKQTHIEDEEQNQVENDCKVLSIQVKKEKFYEKIINFFKQLFHL